MYEWDEAKRQETLMSRGINFASVADFDWDSALILHDNRARYGEQRFRAAGLIDGRLHMLVFTPRGGKIRIISLRKANRREITKWQDR